MLKKTIRRLGALAMVLAMAVSVFAVNASAAEGDTGSEVEPVVGIQMTITKKVTLKEKVLAPNTEFRFTVGAGATGLKYDGYDVIQGEANDWTVGDAVTVTKSTTSPTVATGTTTMTLNKTYTEPGIYSYKVSETAGNYDGMIYDTTVKNVLVFVEYNSTTEKYVPTKAVVVDVNKENVATAAEAKSDLTFTNKYDDAEEGTHDLTVTKNVTGKLGNRSKGFEFTIKITADGEGQKAGTKEKYFVETTGTITSSSSSSTIEDDAELKVTLKDGEYVKIYGLSPKDTYSVTETDYTSDGYTTSYQVNDEKAIKGRVASNVMEKADKNITYTNDKDTTTPGGVIMTIAPYALMVVLAGAFAVVFLTRRNRAE